MTEEELDPQNGDMFKKSLKEHFGKLEDYRRQESIKYLLIDILFITICAVICGANNLKAVAHYAERKKHWLIGILELESGVPSYSTFWTVFVLLDPQSLGQCFVQWVKSKLSLKDDNVINIDGKAQRGTVKRGQAPFVRPYCQCLGGKESFNIRPAKSRWKIQ